MLSLSVLYFAWCALLVGRHHQLMLSPRTLGIRKCRALVYNGMYTTFILESKSWLAAGRVLPSLSLDSATDDSSGRQAVGMCDANEVDADTR